MFEIISLILRPLAGCDLADGSEYEQFDPLSYVPLRGVMLRQAFQVQKIFGLVLRPLTGCDGKNEQK